MAKKYRAIGLMVKSYAGEVDFEDNESGNPIEVQALNALNRHFKSVNNEDDRDVTLEHLMVKE